jgi:hypothetical protein
MEYKGHEIIINIRRIIVEEATVDDNGDPDEYFESWHEETLSRWYTASEVDGKFRTINGIKKAIDKLERDQ